MDGGNQPSFLHSAILIILLCLAEDAMLRPLYLGETQRLQWVRRLVKSESQKELEMAGYGVTNLRMYTICCIKLDTSNLPLKLWGEYSNRLIPTLLQRLSNSRGLISPSKRGEEFLNPLWFSFETCRIFTDCPDSSSDTTAIAVRRFQFVP